VSAFQVEMFDQAAGVRTRLEMIIEGRMRASANGDRFHIAADAAVYEHRLTLDLPAVKSEEAMFCMAL
jgi:hypothetical protein